MALGYVENDTIRTGGGRLCSSKKSTCTIVLDRDRRDEGFEVLQLVGAGGNKAWFRQPLRCHVSLYKHPLCTCVKRHEISKVGFGV